jgi:hypothetical protein
VYGQCVFITAVPITKLFARGGGGDGGHVLRETTSRGLCELVCPMRTRDVTRFGNVTRFAHLVTRFTHAALDPPLWIVSKIVPNKALSLSFSLTHLVRSHVHAPRVPL